MRWHVYILECADGSLYTGITNDIDRRIKHHTEGKAARYTRGRTPVTLYYCEACRDRSHASRREAEIKKLSRREKLVLKARKSDIGRDEGI